MKHTLEAKRKASEPEKHEPGRQDPFPSLLGLHSAQEGGVCWTQLATRAGRQDRMSPMAGDNLPKEPEMPLAKGGGIGARRMRNNYPSVKS